MKLFKVSHGTATRTESLDDGSSELEDESETGTVELRRKMTQNPMTPLKGPRYGVSLSLLTHPLGPTAPHCPSDGDYCASAGTFSETDLQWRSTCWLAQS